MPKDYSMVHHRTEVLTLAPGERIVSAKVDVNVGKSFPVQIAFILYDAI